MDVQRLVTLLLIFAVVASSARMFWFAWRRAPQNRPRAWRLVVLVMLQVASIALLYRVMLPPPVVTGVKTLVVATARAPGDIATRLSSHERLVALPESPPISASERVPDLATALRRHGGAARLRVVGGGLTARDRESVHGIPLTFEPAPLPRGVIELSLPARVQPGSDFHIHGRVHDLRGGNVELLDPSGNRVDREPLDGDGRFILTAATRTPGLVEFRLRLHDARGRLVDDATIPLSVVSPKPARVLVLAGGPDAELKYLRRWALDSGTKLHTQIQVGAGVQLGDAPIALNAATLKEFDAVILDERAWDALGDSRRRTITDAVRNGLGLLLRVTGPVSPAGRRSLATLGLRFANGAQPTSFALPSTEGSSDFVAERVGAARDASDATRIADSALPALTRQAMRLDTTGAHTWLRDREGRPLAAWRAVGRGRASAWLPTDTYQLVLMGREDVHAALWSQAVGAIARAGTEATFAMPSDARQGERVKLCEVRNDASVTAPTGKTSTVLLVDPATGPARCAGFWPREAGWHALHDGAASVPFHIRGGGELPGVTAFELHEATERLRLASKTATATPPTFPGARRPWFLAWLLVSAVLWWLERSRLGRGGTV